LLLCSGNP